MDERNFHFQFYFSLVKVNMETSVLTIDSLGSPSIRHPISVALIEGVSLMPYAQQTIQPQGEYISASLHHSLAMCR